MNNFVNVDNCFYFQDLKPVKGLFIEYFTWVCFSFVAFPEKHLVISKVRQRFFVKKQLIICEFSVRITDLYDKLQNMYRYLLNVIVNTSSKSVIETSQLICNATRSTGFYIMVGILALIYSEGARPVSTLLKAVLYFI